mgnify:CR=1 FL=1
MRKTVYLQFTYSDNDNFITKYYYGYYDKIFDHLNTLIIEALPHTTFTLSTQPIMGVLMREYVKIN